MTILPRQNDDFWMTKRCCGTHHCATWKVFGTCFRHCFIFGIRVFGVLALAKARFCIKWLECQWEAACLYSFPDKMAFLDFGRCLGWCGVGAKWQFYRGSRMIAAFSVLLFWETVLGNLYSFRVFLSSLFHLWK